MNAAPTPILTISIPTYNRASYLALSLKRITEEVASLEESWRRLVNIYVSDNASTDDTPHVVSAYQDMDVNEFKSVRQVQNIGGNPNIAQCYQTATTPYVWVLGDDDVILPGGLRLVLEQLIKQDLDIIFVGSYGYSHGYLDAPKTLIETKRTLITDQQLEFTRCTNVMLTFISAFIIRSSIDYSAFADVLEDSSLPQLGWIFTLLRNGKRFAIIKNWVIAAKRNNGGGYGLAQIFGINLQKVANAMLQDRPELLKAIQNGTILKFFPSAVMREYRGKSTKFEEADFAAKLKKTFGDNWRYHIFVAPLIYLPISLARIYHLAISIFLRLFQNRLI